MFKKMRIPTILLALILLASCNDKPKSTEQTVPENKKETTVTKIKPAEPLKRDASDFGGIWVNKKYVDKLLASKSPKKSQDVTPITMLILPNNLNQEATVIWGFHEGTTGKVVKKNGTYEILSEESGEPGQTFQLEKDRIKTKKDEFIKIKVTGGKNDYNVVEQLLFAGKYEIDGKQVEFTPNGKVTGLDSFSYYSVLIDYYDAGMQVDQIRLGKSFENSKLFGFEFTKNKLTIYELKCVKSAGDHCEVVKNGKKLYKLIKK